MLRYFSTSFLIGSSLMHVLCCGLPLILSLSSFTALLGISGVEVNPHDSWFEPYELPVMIVAGIFLMLSVISVIISKIVDCRKDGICKHAPCSKKKNASAIILAASILLYSVNIALYMSAH